jgi:two-component system sensor histidine kinase/response regulator
LVRQINNLLDLSKSDEADLAGAPAPVALEELVADVKRSFQPRADTKEVSLVVDTRGLRVLADQDLLRRVVENLLDNALRHAPHGTTVTIAAKRDADGVVLRVADQGLGIPEHMREKVFERYVQAGDVRSVKGSYGLGLAFCKLAVEHQGGRIWIEDGQPGAAFCVSLRHVD